MRAIIVDDEQIMLRSFMRLSKGISNLNVIAQFENPEDALLFVQENAVELAFLDIKMPGMNGIETGSEDSQRFVSEYFNRVYFRLR